ncbi:hypothetical protein KXR83_05910 [Williamsia muralis]|uniref:hypothetical protein n=1 Tax=Williamsia marianensis TaxID=85044 RepID=UPI003F158B75
MTDTADIRDRARTWMEVGPDDPGYVEPEREVVTLVADLLAALETVEAERDELHRDGQVLRGFRDNALAERDAARVVIAAVRKWKSVNTNDNPDFTSLSEILRAGEWRAARPEVTP